MQQQGLRGVAVSSSVASAPEFGVWKVNTKAPALMTVWSAARGAGRLSKRGHSFCLRSLAGPIQPPTPLQHPLSARFPHQEGGRGEGSMPASLSSSLLSPHREPEPPHSAASDRTSGSAYKLLSADFRKPNFRSPEHCVELRLFQA